MRALSLLLILLCACAGVDPLVVTGESLNTMSQTFVETAAAMDAGLDAGRVTADQYRAWAVFGRKFQVAYDKAIDLWEVARDTRDAQLERDVATILARLAAELATFKPRPSVDGGA